MKENANKIGILTKVANGHLSFEIEDAKGNIVKSVSKMLKKHFNFKPNRPIVLLDEVLINGVIDKEKITVSWDNWSGLFIMADSDLGDSIIESIGDYINKNYSSWKQL